MNVARCPARLQRRSSGRRSQAPSTNPTLVDALTINRADIVRDGVLDLASFTSSSGVWNDVRVAVKTCVPAAPANKVLREVAAFMDLPPSPHLVAVYGVCVEPTVCLVVQLCANGSMQDLLYGSRARPFSPAERLALARGTAEGLAHLHRHGLVHGTLTARHVLLDERMTPKLSDFPASLAQYFSWAADHEPTSDAARWWSPERLTPPHPATAPADCWSLSVLFFEIYATSLPYSGLSLDDALSFVSSGGRLAVPPLVPLPLSTLLRSIWLPTPSPATRPTVRTVCTVLANSDCQ